MQKCVLLSGILCLTFLLTILSCRQEALTTTSTKVLVFSKTEEFRHTSIAAGKQALLELAERYQFRVDTTEDASRFHIDSLADYHVIVFLNTTGDVLNEEQQLAMQAFVQGGGGFVGVHSATDTEYGWPWYGQLVGAYFEGHPAPQEARIDRLIADHPSTRMLPEVWTFTEEWYNHRSIQPGLQILLSLDERSYSGGANGDPHPISWYQAFDGGRSWYTGLGHSEATYTDSLFLQHLYGGIQYAAGPGTAVDFTKAVLPPEENRFQIEVLTEVLHEPMEMDLLPDGKILFIERHGTIKCYDPAIDSVQIVAKMNLYSKLEDGLLGLAVDPAFAENRWIYLYYSDPEVSRQNLSRFTLTPDYSALEAGSEKQLLYVTTQRDECCHAGGSIEFGPGGLLHIATGDNTNPFESDGFSPADERPGRSPWDAQKSSANTNDLRGKILRIKPEADGTYSIPDGNLFTDPQVGRPEIYAMGTRNSFRLSVDQRNGYVYWGDVGPDAGEAYPQRGPRGHDEVNQARQAGFFGWPYFVGNNKPYYRFDFARKTVGDKHDPAQPRNTSPNNTGAIDLPPAQPAFIWYPYAESPEFPLLGTGGRNAMAGPVFYVDDYADSEIRFPAYYDGKLFIYDWMRGWVMAVTMDSMGNYQRMEHFLPSQKFHNPVDMLMGPDGEMYILEYGTVWNAQNADARLLRITYNGGNRKPLAHISADKRAGAAPLTIRFSAAASKDYDQDALSYEWYFENLDEPAATTAEPVHTFTTPGEYTVYLVVSDPEQQRGETRMQILVGNEPPQVQWNIDGNRTFFWDQQELSYNVQVSDQEDGSLGGGIPAEQVAVSIDYLERGFDVNEIAMGHQALLSGSRFMLGEQLMAQSDCQSCHRKATASIGPTYVAIAEKYTSDLRAEDYLSDRIIKGGGGVWGEQAMAAHPQLSKDEATQMVKYILSLAKATPNLPGLPVKGSYAFTKHQPGQTEGSYILTASYTDQGGQIGVPLSGREVITLRYPLLRLKSADALENVDQTDDEKAVIVQSNSWIGFKAMDLSQVGYMDLLLQSGEQPTRGGTVQIRVDSPTGPIIGEGQLPVLTSATQTETSRIPIAPTEGMQDFYLTFSGSAQESIALIEALQIGRRKVVQ